MRFGLPLPFLAVTCRATERALLRRFGPIDAVWLVHGQKITETRARDATHARGTPGVPAVHRGTTADIPDRSRTTPLHPRRQNSDFAYFDTFGAFWRYRVLIPPFNVLLVPAPKMTLLRAQNELGELSTLISGPESSYVIILSIPEALVAIRDRQTAKKQNGTFFPEILQ